MNRPPVTYPATLADLTQFSDAALELDELKNKVADKPDEHARLTAIVKRLYETIDRLAGPDADLVYGPGDEPTIPQPEPERRGLSTIKQESWVGL